MEFDLPKSHGGQVQIEGFPHMPLQMTVPAPGELPDPVEHGLQAPQVLAGALLVMQPRDESRLGSHWHQRQTRWRTFLLASSQSSAKVIQLCCLGVEWSASATHYDARGLKDLGASLAPLAEIEGGHLQQFVL
eukprot:1928682-Amphidinium_carterae.1